MDREITIFPATFAIICYENRKQLEPHWLRNLETYIGRKLSLQVIYTNNPSEEVKPITESTPHLAAPTKGLKAVGSMVYEEIGQMLKRRQESSKNHQST